MAAEENKKIKLVREVFLHLYSIATEYRSIAEKQAQELENKELEISNLKTEINDLMLRQGEIDKNTDIDTLLEELAEEKEGKIKEKQKLIDKYLTTIANDVDKLSKNMENFSAINSKVSRIDETIDEQLLQVAGSINAIEDEIKEIGNLFKSESKGTVQTKKKKSSAKINEHDGDILDRFSEDQQQTSLYND